MPLVRVALILVLLCAGDVFAQAKLDPREPYRARASDTVTYRVDLSAVVTPPYKAKSLKVWTPIPPSDEAQVVADSKFTTFPMKVDATIGTESVHGNRFAFFEFKNPQGAQIVRHQFTIRVHEMNWDIDAARIDKVADWPKSFEPYLRGEKLIPVDGKVRDLAATILKGPKQAPHEIFSVMDWVNRTMKYSHEICSLQGSAVHALDHKIGHCSDYHGLCNSLGRSLGYPTRIVYGINPYPKNSPSHCKLEAYLPPYGWVAFDVSETQQLIAKIRKDSTLDDAKKEQLAVAAQKRLWRGFRDNTWFMQTRGSDYDLAPPASRKVAVVRTIYAEADGEALPEPDPANPKLREFGWMTVHHYEADRVVPNPFQDWRTLQPAKSK